MTAKTAIKPKLHAKGAWYTSPGGLLFDRDDRGKGGADARLRRLREHAGDEPPYSHKKVVITYAVIGLIHAPLAVLHAGAKLAIKELDIGDWISLGSIFVVVLLFLGMAVKNALFPPQRTPISMFKGYLAAAIGLSRGRAYAMLLRHDRDDRLREIPPPIVGDGGDAVAFNDQNKFERYWLQVFGGAWHPWKSLALREARTAELAPDLVLVDAKIVVFTRNTVRQFLALIPVLLGAVITIISLFVLIAIASSAGENLDEAIIKWVYAAFAPVGLGLLVGFALVLYGLVKTTRHEFPLRKLIVHVNGQWRVFNGELQGADETDVTWALETTEARVG